MKKKLLTILLSIFMIMGAYTTRVFANEITNVGDVIATNPNFPSDPEDGWTFVGDGVTAITYVNNDKLYFQEKGNPTSNINVATTATLTKENDDYTVNSSDGKVTFVMESNSLKNITVSGSSNETLNGTYTILLYWGYDDSKETLYLSKTASAITTKGSLDANVFDATKVYTSQSVGWTGIQSDVEKVEILNEIKPSNMNSWFDKMSKLTQIIGITNLNTESVVSMSGLFYKCEKLETIDLSNFDTSNVTSMQNMFAYCSNLTSLTFGEKFDTSKVKNMSSMFGMCSSLEMLDLRNFDTSKAANVKMMFYGCSSLKTLDLSSFDLSSADNAANLIDIATSLVQIKTPKNLKNDNALPSLVDPAAWYNAENFEKYKFSNLPINSTTSITLVAGYPITVSEGIINGTVTVAVAPTTDGNYIVGSTVTLTVAPSNGYQLKANSLKATYYDGVQNQTIIPTATQTEGQYTFTMPAYTVTVTAEFEEKAITIADILPDDFPTCVDVLPPNLWVNGNEVNMMVIPSSLVIFTLDGDGNPDYVELANDIRTATLTKNGNNYTYTNNGVTTTFLMSDNGLESVKIEGLTGDYVDFNGTYGGQHAHAFTYTANNGKLTATCIAGCDKGYNTNPLTLTLTAPSNLVYDGNAKKVSFAVNEADAWVTAGLELPTITYTAKQGSALTNNKAIDAGSYIASITVDTNKTASLDFEITKVTPYIKTKPQPNAINLGDKLEVSTLADYYVQASETNTTQIGGLFEWANPDTIPALEDSNVTLYDVTFTPADEYTKNYSSTSCQVTITVNHTHNPALVNGQAPTETASGWKYYYECICGEYYEDAAGSVLIPDLNVWKAEGGNGYIAPLAPSIDYEIISGNNANINIDNNKDALFTSDADYSKFERVEIDGTTVDHLNYTVESGSTKVTLKASYLNTLSVGQHTVDIISTDGHASTTFTITKNSPSPNPGYVVPNTGIDGTYSNNHSLLKLSSLSLLIVGTYMVIKKKKDND